MDDDALFGALAAETELARVILKRGVISRHYLSSADLKILQQQAAIIGDIDVAKYLTGLKKATQPAPVDNAPPTVPTGLAAVALSATSIRLTWTRSTDAGTGVAGYRIFRNGQFVTTINDIPGGMTFDDTGLSPITIYTYTVAAYDRASPVANTSAQSLPASATTNAPPADTTPPTVPTGLVCTALDQTRIAATWNASTDAQSGVHNYDVYLGGVFNQTVTGTSATITGLAASTLYNVQVLARDNATVPNVSALCTAVPCTTLANQPGSAYRVNAGGAAVDDPQGNTYVADEAFTGSTALDWQQLGVAGISNDQGIPRLYLTERYGAGMHFTKNFPNGQYIVRIHFCENYITWPTGAGVRVMTIVINGVTVTSSLDVFALVGPHAAMYVDYPVTITNGQLDIVFSAVNQNGMCNGIEVISTGANADIVAPTVPSGVVATALSDTAIGLTWNDSTDVGTGLGGYRIKRNGALVGTSTGPSFQDSGLTPNTLYNYTIEAFDKASPPNISAPSGIAAATTKQATVDTSSMKVLYRWCDYTARMTEFLTAPAGSYGVAIYNTNKNLYDDYTGGIDPIITSNIAAIHTANLKLLGHITGVETVNGLQKRTSAASFLTRANAWFAACPTLDGLFVGAAARDSSDWVAEWAIIIDNFHATHPGKVLFFHGGDGLGGLPAATDAEMQILANKADNLLMAEEWNNTGHSASPSVPTFPAWMSSYPRSKFSAIENNISLANMPAMEAYFLAHNIGFAYITDVDVPNAENATYWSNFKAGLGGGTPPTALGIPVIGTITGGAGAVSVPWSSVAGATGYDLFRDGVLLAAGATSPYTDATFGANESHNYQVRAKNATLFSSLSAPVTYSTVTATTNANFPMLPNGVLNQNGGHRDLTKHPFLPDSPWNQPIRDSAVFTEAYIHVIPSAEDYSIINGQPMFYNIAKGYYEPITGDIVGAGGVYTQMDPTLPLTDVGVNKNGPTGDASMGVDRCTPGPTVFQLPWPPALYIESNPSDGHYQVLTSDGDTYKEASYIQRCAAFGGRIAQYADVPDQGSLKGNGLTYGSHGASHVTSLGGLLRQWEMIPVARGGLGFARHAIALGLALYHGRSLDYPDAQRISTDVREVGPMHTDKLFNAAKGYYAGEYSVRGYGGPNNGPGPYARLTTVRVGSRIAVPLSLLSTLYGQMQSEFGQLLLQSMVYYGGYNMDTGEMTKMNFYASGGVGPVAPLDDFVTTWENVYQAPFRCRGDWSAQWATAPNKNALPAWLQVVGPMGIDVDLIFRNAKVVSNDGPGAWGGGTGSPLQPMAPL